MTANGGKISPSIAKLVDEAIGQVLEAQRLIAELQSTCNSRHDDEDARPQITNLNLWNRLESIDDRLHDALTKLGD